MATNISSIDDLEHMKPCFKCGELLDIEDGEIYTLERTGTTGRVTKIVNALSGDGPKSLFVCPPCKAKIRRNKFIVWGLFYLLVFILVLLTK